MNDIPAGEKCCRAPYTGWGGRPLPCGNPAKMEHEGKFYCGAHNPVKRAARQDERDKVRSAERAATNARNTRLRNIAAARGVVVDAAKEAVNSGEFGGLVAAVADLLEAEGAP